MTTAAEGLEIKQGPMLNAVKCLSSAFASAVGRGSPEYQPWNDQDYLVGLAASYLLCSLQSVEPVFFVHRILHLVCPCLSRTALRYDGLRCTIQHAKNEAQMAFCKVSYVKDVTAFLHVVTGLYL